MKKDIAIIGGSIGGVLAAYTAAKLGQHVVLTEETAWIGGQLTSQAVPPDEHPWIETFGSTKTYRNFRNDVRDYYKRKYPVTEEARENERLNPGNGWVSRIAHEPRVSLALLYDLLQPYISNGRIELLLNHKPVRAEVIDDVVQQVVVVDDAGQERVLEASVFLDATELGDVLPLANVDYVVGAESREDTGEPNAPLEPNPLDVQSITHVMALEYVDGEDFTIDKPAMYDFWRNYKAPFLDHMQLSEFIPDAHTGKSKKMPFFSGENGSLGMWEYRRIIDKKQYKDGFFAGDVSLINWPQNDYWLGSIIDVSEAEKQKRLEEARQLSLSLLYWLQTEAPRDDGSGKGYPGFRLRPDVVGTKDGLAMHPYIRESRRIKARYTVTEHDINADLRGDNGVRTHEDSVGVGAYRIDLHPTTVHNRLFYAKSYPFEIPLGSLIPIKVKNLLPACKNIGTTQLTNGCFRVHPAEWNIGESAGALAAFSLKHGVKPVDVYEDQTLTKAFQDVLEDLGVQLHWPEVYAF
ncbi:FAD-dependent oxidoreductase [Ornithinibacillus halotolerans]|uniref:FAD-dependent oxidoreductase n=1 Tax=Ornithinibacillus halotolerans TaxID=1274357 RepID=A0A916S1U8_9BACI|nr:FAD-dependent oxidoreductase [Ornithinibacillus halotolerans]GGA79494.1 FAD-dependent oxidoreductase [Ornithinibacillus halotolerans]